MRHQNHNKKQDESVISSIVTKVAGAAVVAGVAVAATVVLQDKKTREKVKKVLVNAKDQAVEHVEMLKAESKDSQASDTVKSIVKDTKKMWEKAKATLNHTEIDGKKVEIKKTPARKGK